MNFLVLGIIFGIFTLSSAHAEDAHSLIFLQPEVRYGVPRIFADSQAASYSGFGYGGAIYYKIGDPDFSFAPYVSYTLGDFSNTANSAVRTETAKTKTIGIGIKLYFENIFIRAGAQSMSLEVLTTGNVNQTIKDSGIGFILGLGYSIPLSNYFKLELSLDSHSTKFSANSSGFPIDSQYLGINGTVGIGILIPSSPPRSSRFKTRISDY